MFSEIAIENVWIFKKLFVDKSPSDAENKMPMSSLFLEKYTVVIHIFSFLRLPCLCVVIEVNMLSVCVCRLLYKHC